MCSKIRKKRLLEKKATEIKKEAKTERGAGKNIMGK
jgi:hypothetical protein